MAVRVVFEGEELIGDPFDLPWFYHDRPWYVHCGGGVTAFLGFADDNLRLAIAHASSRSKDALVSTDPDPPD